MVQLDALHRTIGNQHDFLQPELGLIQLLEKL